MVPCALSEVPCGFLAPIRGMHISDSLVPLKLSQDHFPSPQLKLYELWSAIPALLSPYSSMTLYLLFLFPGKFLHPATSASWENSDLLSKTHTGQVSKPQPAAICAPASSAGPQVGALLSTPQQSLEPERSLFTQDRQAPPLHSTLPSQHGVLLSLTLEALPVL